MPQVISRPMRQDQPPGIPGYEIIRELHRGGQGVVYEALQRSAKRKVAIKVMLAGPFSSKAARKRFEREIELVAQLRHPNIIPVFHSGETDQGLPFFVMEYVRGTRLDQFVREKKPPLEDVLLLFAKVCEAVQYAHQKGVIHRDLKPSNIIVDFEGTPRVLDFGLAKLLAGPVETVVSVSAEILGTIPYMSPEQVRGNPDEIDTRSDVYALGVVLYELLTGRLPYPSSSQMAELIRHIAETPPSPPTATWSTESGITERANRRSRPGHCPIDDEVETIVLKALSKDRARRYQSAGELARDLGHYLAGEPIEARRDSGWYILRSTLRRYRVQAAATCATAILLTAVAITTSLLYRRALIAETEEARQRTIAERQEFELATERASARAAEQAESELALMLTNQLVAAMYAGDYLSARALNKEAAKGVSSSAHSVLATAFMEVGDLEEAWAEFGIAAVLARGDPARLAQIKINTSKCALELGRYSDAGRYLEEAVTNAVNARLDPRSRLVLQRNVGRFYITLHRLDQAEAELTKVWEEQKNLFSAEDVETLATELLALIQYHRGDFGKAMDRVERIIASLENVLGPDHTDVADARLQLATIEANLASHYTPHYCQSALREADQAVAVLDKALGGGRLRNVGAALERLGVAERCWQVTGDPAPVSDAFADVVPRVERLASQLGEDNVFVAKSRVFLAGISADSKPEDALQRIAEAEVAYRKHVPKSDRCHPAILRLLEAKARIQGRMGDHQLSLDVCRTGLECTAEWFARHPMRANLLGTMAADQWNLGAKDEARRTFSEAYEVLIATYPQEHPWVREFQQRHRELSEAAP